MTNNIFNASVATSIVTALNLKLLSFAIINLEDSREYKEILDNLKKAVKAENSYYNALSDMEIHMYFDFIKGVKKFANMSDARVYARMKDEKRIRDGSKVVNDNILLSSIISSKLTIDILKNIDSKIIDLDRDNSLEIDDIEMLKMYAKRFKYHYLSSNYFIEMLSIEHGYDLDSIPSYTFGDIENRFGVPFVEQSRETFRGYVLAAIKELASLKTDDKYALAYSSLFECARIETLLPYLNSDDIDEILHLYDDSKYRYDANSALRKVKKIILKRKEEFSE